MYALAKARVLALGYGAGWHKFIEMARGYLGSEEQFLAIFAAQPPAGATEKFLDYLGWMVGRLAHAPSKKLLNEWAELDGQTKNIWVNAWVQVSEFRSSNQKIKELWQRFDEEILESAEAIGPERGIHETELPSGRVLKYFEVTRARGSQARPNDRMAIPTRAYGGLLTENCVQACSRDLFLHGILNLEAAGYRVLFHVHDEAVVEAKQDADPAEVVRLLTAVPNWADGLPVAAEAEVASHYKK